MKKSAFTLIELLVVIAIIAILAGIALPVFSKVQEHGRAIQDGSNLRQVGIAVTAYTNDNGDTLPKGTGTGWSISALYPTYISSYKAFQSPFDRRTPSEKGDNSTPISYSFNSNLIPTTGYTMTDVISPTNTIMMSPLYTGDPNLPGSWTGTAVKVPSVAAGGIGMSQGTHSANKQIDVLYCDTHVASIKFGPSSNTATFQDSQSNPDGQKRWDPTK